MLFVFSTLIVRAQNPIIEGNDTTAMTEYNDGVFMGLSPNGRLCCRSNQH